jgi:hypothetical protein
MSKFTSAAASLALIAGIAALPGASAQARGTGGPASAPGHRTTHKRAPASRTAASHAKVIKTSSAARSGGTGVVGPVRTAGPSVAAISAFPAGGKGSGTEATCELWSDRLQEDQNAQDSATDKQDVIDATESLNSDIDNALDAGCAVIY